jgi:hypothetical protein
VWLFGLCSLYFAAISLWRTFVLGDKGEEEEAEAETKQEEQGAA